MKELLRVEAPVRTVSEMNVREHWAVRNKRRAKQRRMVYYAWKVAVAGKRRLLGAPCTVRLTRLGAKLLDSDNLQMSFKHIRDQVAELLGMDDADERLTFEYAQEAKRDFGVVIEVFQEPHRP